MTIDKWNKDKVELNLAEDPEATRTFCHICQRVTPTITYRTPQDKLGMCCGYCGKVK